ncbi:substrate-binding periplasmic protein [Gimibacter soli]|uniref:Solute-binding protein family 3/N-terminal domain-containing protein n=1 Tax=Gimibacter soli TaxID=3024400 RepID=A0AAE9XTR5_9PROT|nr:hypothetical protein [Gimibacter soli]WCL55075.1 hypothetical protein PH603_04785 [Gimibacter soli]
MLFAAAGGSTSSAAVADSAPVVSAHANHPAQHLYATGWGLTLKADGTGFYNELMKFVLSEAGFGPDYRVMPYNRAVGSLKGDEDGCLYPAYTPIMRPNGLDEQLEISLEASEPLLRVVTHLFSQPGRAPLARLEDLQGKLIGHPMGSRIAEVLAPYGARYMASLDETAKAKLLLTGRVDYISASLPDAAFVFQALGEELPPYNPDLMLVSATIGVVCRPSMQGRAFIAAISAALLRLRENGRLAEFFEGRGVPVDIHLPVGRPSDGIAVKPQR